jgi:alcohol-forming fatty acyl-CoA reductase
MYSKTEAMTDLLKMFTSKQWKFDNSNTIELLSSLSKEDRDKFEFSMENFNWKQYTTSYYYGIRKHILHEDLSNMVEAKSRNRKYIFFLLYYLYYYIKILVSLFLVYYY